MKAFALFALAAALVSPQAQPPQTADDSSSDLLVTGDSVEALTRESEVAVSSDRALSLAPGIRMTRVEEGVQLSTHDGAPVEIRSGTETIALPSPVFARITPGGWEIGSEKKVSTSTIAARRRQQDDTDANLKAMQDSAKKLRKRSQPSYDPNTAFRKWAHYRWLYWQNPFVTSEIFKSPALLQLIHISPMGF